LAERVWLDDTPYEWLQRNLRLLSRTMLASAIVDVLWCAACLFVPRRVAGFMGLEAFSGSFYFYMWPLVHLVFASFCLPAWLDVKRNIVIVAGAIAARGVYAAYALVAVLWLGARPTWMIPGGISLVFAIAHYVLLRSSDFRFWEVVCWAGNPPGASLRGRRR